MAEWETPSSAVMLRIHLLGAFRVAAGQHALDEDGWGLTKAASVVKLLALSPGHRMHRERALEYLWPDASLANAANSLHRTLHVARRALEPSRAAPTSWSFLQLRSDVLVLSPSTPIWVDVDAFEQAAAQARHSRSLASYSRALALYTGDLLPHDLYEDWTSARREELRELHATILAEAARLHIAQGSAREAISLLRKLVRAEPLRENAYVTLMRLYALAGERYDALRQYQRLRTVMHEELDTTPSPEAQRLYAAIQAGRFPAPRDAAPAPNAPDAMQASDQAGSRMSVVTPPARTVPLPMSPALANTLDAQTTSFVGRAHELAEMRRLLADNRLVTVTGPGGGGKTRLAAHVAAGIVQDGDGDAQIIELASVTDPDLVPQAVAAALGVREVPNRPLADTLAEALHPRRLLLVLDNCEHLLGACATLARDLLAACPRLRILATSRQPLGTAGEVIWSLPALALPDPEHLPPLARLLEYDALQLFVARAMASRPSFRLSSQNAATVLLICRRLDGLPLAIELAAVRVKLLTVEQIAERLDDCFALLGRGSGSDPRHETIQATIDWSWDLLSDRERILLRRLAVFAGGWTLDGAEAVCASDSLDQREILNLLSDLVEKSLVLVEERDDTMRHRLLETVRQYAASKLTDAGEADVLYRRYFDRQLALAEESDKGLQGGEQEHWLAVLSAEHANMRAALTWAQDAGEVILALRLAATLGRFWYLRGFFREGRHWLARALALDAQLGQAAPGGVRARALQEAGLLAMFEADFPAAETLGAESLRLWRELDNPLGINVSLSTLAGAAEFQGDYQRAAELNAECLELARRIGDPWRITVGVSNLADQLAHLGQLEQAAELYRESLALARRHSNRAHIGMALTNLGRIALRRSDGETAARLLEEALDIMRELRNQRGTGEALLPLGELALRRGDAAGALARYAEALAVYQSSDVWLGVAQSLEGLSYAVAAGAFPAHVRQAARQLGAAEALRARIGTPRTPNERSQHNDAGAALRARLGAEAFTREHSAGEAAPIARVIAEALAEWQPKHPDEADAPTPASAPTPPAAASPRLTEREREVAELIAVGLTNRAIAERLRISSRTAEKHASNILSRLGLTARTEIAAWLRVHPRSHT